MNSSSAYKSSALSTEQVQRLMALVTEAQNRGIDLNLTQLISKSSQQAKLPFPKDDNGHYTRIDGKFYNPSEMQLNFINSQARFCAFIGSRGSGKSAGGAQKALHKIEAGLSGVVINPDFENFKVSTWPEFRDWIPWQRVVVPQRYRMHSNWQPLQPFILSFDTGANVICKGLKDPDSARGPNVNWLWYDEAQRDRTGAAWQIAVASVRIGHDPQAWVTATPRGKLHWLHEFFIEQNIPQDAIDLFKDVETRLMVEFFRGTIEDNRMNLDPGFYASMLAAYPSGYLRDQEIKGEFVDPTGILGNPAWFDGKVVDNPPDAVKERIRYWDLAASEKKISGRKAGEPDASVGTKLSWDGELKFCIENQVHGHWAWAELKEKIVETARIDGPYVAIYVEQEPAAGGKNQVEELKSHIQKTLGTEFKITGHRPEGDKVMRANAWFAEASQGRFTIVKGEWNRLFLDQLGGFPEAAHDDHIDSVSGARQIIAPFRTWKHIKFLAV